MNPGPASPPAEVDAVVVGAGTAGCVVARRLLDAGLTVLVLEAGPDHVPDRLAHPAIDALPRMHELWDSEVDWGYRTVPQEHAHDRRLHLPRGRVVGGSHALNATVWVRGHRADYDTWAHLGNPHWSWADVEPVFHRIEGGADGAPDDARTGPLDVLSGFEPDPVHQAIVDAAVQHGLPFNPNYNGARPDGVSFMELTVRDGRRFMTAEAYLGPVRAHERLHVVPGARVHRLLFDGNRCVGVEWDRDGVREQVRAGSQVVLTAGALGSPFILQRSGVGDPDLLRRLGIDVVLPLRGVGRNLQDHWLVPVIAATSRPIELSAGLPACQTHLFWRSRPELAVPDLQPIHFAVPLVADWMSSPEHGISLLAGLVRPASRGHVEITSADPDAAPRIDPRVLSAPEDVDALVAAVRLCQGILREPALRDGWGAQEVYPASLAAGPEQARDYVRETVLTYHHQAGTCAMGQHADAVVDQFLRVHGADGLTVADASVMPVITSGNTNAPSAMIGERAATFVLSGQ